jgi:hypothetical protein
LIHGEEETQGKEKIDMRREEKEKEKEEKV